MKINGAYKFKTRATVNTLISTYVKVEFYSGEDKITPNEYASILTEGFTNDFNMLSNLYYIYWTLPVGSEPPLNIFRTSVDTSCRIVITIIGANERGNIIYSRVFDNAQQYGLFTDERIAELNNNGIQHSIRLDASVPPVYVFPEINQDNTFSFYGVILGGMDTFGLFSPHLFAFPHITQKQLCIPRTIRFSYPSHSFKNNEELIDICEKVIRPESDFIDNTPTVQGLPVYFYYFGDGTWRGDASTYGVIGQFEVEMIVTRYPGVQNSIFPPNYLLDMDRIVTYSTGEPISDIPFLKDSKTGKLFREKWLLAGGGEEYDFQYFLGDDLIYSEILYSGTYSRTRISPDLSLSKSSFFLHDNNFYSCLIKYNSSHELVTLFNKNVRPELYFNSSSEEDDTVFGVLTKNKTPQMFETKNIKMLPDFINALLETYPFTSEPSFPNGSYWSSLFAGNVYNTNYITPGLPCCSALDKTLWRYYDSIFVPSEIEWG